MNKIFLSETEKIMLSRLGKSLYIKGMFKDIHLSDLNVAAKDLQNFGLINASWAYDSIFIDAEITDKGIVYLKENPNLENPIDEEELKKYQKDEFEYKERIRRQEGIIRLWKLLSAIIGIISVLGWLFLFFFFKFIDNPIK